MSDTANQFPGGPEGEEFFSLLDVLEGRCEQETARELPRMGDKAPSCYRSIGTILSLLDRLASCWWKCRAGDHCVEYLCGRARSNGRASIRLMKMGYYDEALLLVRAVGEVCNLLHLFLLDHGAEQEWKDADGGTRIRAFGPANVRKRIEAVSGNPPITKIRYAMFCERFAHPNPETRPQAHNAQRIPSMAGFFQREGVLVCLNELGATLCLITVFGAKLLDIDVHIREEIRKKCLELAGQIGSADITTIDDFNASLMKSEDD